MVTAAKTVLVSLQCYTSTVYQKLLILKGSRNLSDKKL